MDAINAEQARKLSLFRPLGELLDYCVSIFLIEMALLSVAVTTAVLSSTVHAHGGWSTDWQNT